MRRVQQILACFAMVWGVFSMMEADAQMPKTQGFRECTETCYIKECGEVGIKCPTVTQKRIYRRKCYGYCKEKMARQKRELRWAEYQRRLQLYRERAAEARKMLMLRHKMWMQKRKLVHRMKMEYERAKRERSSKVVVYYRKMQMAREGEMDLQGQKLRMKEKFYASRAKMRREEFKEMREQVKELKKELKSKDAQKRAKAKQELQKREKQVKVAKKKELQLQVSYYKTRVARRGTAVKKIKITRDRLKVEKKEAAKTKDQKKLEALAAKLGALAGQQAAISRKAELDKIKLNKARTVLTSLNK